MSERLSARLAALLLASSMFTPALGIAQQEPPAPDAPSWTPVEAITVTGQRRSYQATGASVTRTPVPLIDVPQSIQVLTGTLLEEQALTTLSDATANVSGVVAAASAEAVLANPIVRGFESEIFVDGLAGYGDTAVIDPSSLAMAERIEVAKGPTSVLFGGGAGAPVGGLINIVTKTPQPDAAYRGEMFGGSFSTFGARLDLNQPLTQSAGVRLAGEVVSSDDFIDAVTIDRLTFNPSVRLRFGTTTELTMRGLVNRIEQLEYAGFPAEIAKAPGVDPFRFSGARNAPRTEIENANLTGVLTHDFSEALRATLQLHHYASDFHERASFPFLSFFPLVGTTAAIIKGELPAQVSQWTADASVTATFLTGAFAHTLFGGVQFDDTLYDASIGFAFAPLGILDYAVPGSDVPYGTPATLTSSFLNDYTTFAVYLQDQVQIGERLSLVAGLRYSELGLRERKAGAGTDKTWGEWNPRLGISYAVLDGVSLFGGWATGSRLSLFFSGTRPPVPETSESFEAGVKFALSEIGLSGTIAAYAITRENVPTPDPLLPFSSVQTGEQRSRGVEADLVWEPDPNWSILAALAFTDAEVRKDTAIPAGDELPRVPKASGRLAVRYRFTDGFLDGLGLGIGMTAATAAEITLPNTLKGDGYTVFDAQASYDIGDVRIGLSATNLFDRTYFVPYQYVSQPVVRPGAPRAVFLTLGASF